MDFCSALHAHPETEKNAAYTTVLTICFLAVSLVLAASSDGRDGWSSSVSRGGWSEDVDAAAEDMLAFPQSIQQTSIVWLLLTAKFC